MYSLGKNWVNIFYIENTKVGNCDSYGKFKYEENICLLEDFLASIGFRIPQKNPKSSTFCEKTNIKKAQAKVTNSDIERHKLNNPKLKSVKTIVNYNLFLHHKLNCIWSQHMCILVIVYS